MGRPLKKITANQRRAILVRYPKKGYGLAMLSKDLGIGIPVIRRVLVENGVKLRSTGRPQTIAAA